MKTLHQLACAAMVHLFNVGVCIAQSVTKAPTDVTIDGVAKEWTTFTPFTSRAGNIDYVISNDKDNLYLVVKTSDVLQQNNILNSGLSFSVDVKDRKRTSFTVTYPTSNDEGSLALTNEQILTAIEAAKQKKITAEGFKDKKKEKIELINPYNIKPAINYDADGNLVYEEAIPLALFNAGEFADKEWAFNIKINSNIRSAGAGSGRDGDRGLVVTTAIVAVPANSGPPSQRNLSTSRPSFVNTPTVQVIDLWVRSPLAKP